MISRFTTLKTLVLGSLVLGPCYFASTAYSQGTRTSGTLVSREALAAAAERAESLALSNNRDARASSAVLAASLRQRLRDGDFQVGDRIVVSIWSDAMHRDTLVVKPGPMLEIPGRIFVPLGGVLRSELQSRVSTEVLKYVKAQQIEVNPLVRIGILGEVAHPGFFALASDLPLAEAIMVAGGPTANADVQRSLVRRGAVQVHSPTETNNAIVAGLTLDQFGVNAGDELLVGRQHQFNSTTLFGVVGAVASLVTVYLALHR